MKPSLALPAIMTDAYGGHGGIAQYNHDFLGASAGVAPSHRLRFCRVKHPTLLLRLRVLSSCLLGADGRNPKALGIIEHAGDGPDVTCSAAASICRMS